MPIDDNPPFLSAADTPAQADFAKSSTPRRRRAPKGESRREALLDAATQVFSRDGYNLASMADIARLVGISNSGLLHHYPSKVALLMAVLERRDRIDHGAVSELRYGQHLSGLFQTLCALNRANAGMLEVVRAFTLLSVESLAEGHPAGDWFRGRYYEIRDRLVEMMTPLVAAGEIRSDVDLVGVVQEILAMMDGLQWQWIRFPGELALITRFELYMNRLEADLRP